MKARIESPVSLLIIAFLLVVRNAPAEEAAKRTPGLVHLKAPAPVDGSLKGLNTLAPFAEWDEPQEVVWGASEWEGIKDFSGKTFLAWDDEFLYVSAVVNDDVVVPGNLTGDGLEIFLDVPRQPGEVKDRNRVIQIGASLGEAGGGRQRCCSPGGVAWRPARTGGGC